MAKGMGKLKNVKLADIAAEAGVSSVAVSKALSGKTGVSEELRSRIKQIAKEKGYVSLSKNKATGNIGVLIPEYYFGHSVAFYKKMYELVKALRDNHYFSILEILTEEDERESSVSRMIRDSKVDGLIIFGQISESYALKMSRQKEIPVFFLDTYLPRVLMDTVIAGEFFGAYELTNFLIEQGNRGIGFVGNVDVSCEIADCFWGYRRALRKSGIEFDERWEIPDRDKEGRIFDKILNSIQEMDAFVCCCDYTALRLVHNLEEEGGSVPDDISVVGFGNGFLQGTDSDRVTLYEVDMGCMARTCVESLIKKIRHEDYTKGVQIISGKIIHKGTVKSRNS